MRLSESEYQVIKQGIYFLDKHAKIVLFGSRAYDKARGGDIDLYIMVVDKNDLFNKELR